MCESFWDYRCKFNSLRNHSGNKRQRPSKCKQINNLPKVWPKFRIIVWRFNVELGTKYIYRTTFLRYFLVKHYDSGEYGNIFRVTVVKVKVICEINKSLIYLSVFLNEPTFHNRVGCLFVNLFFGIAPILLTNSHFKPGWHIHCTQVTVKRP